MQSYERYGAALLRKAERVLQNRDDARDVVQSLFVDLLQSGRHEMELPYLYRAVTHRCLNLLRDRTNRARLLERQAPALRGPARVQCEDLVVGLELLVQLRDRLDDAAMELLVCCFVDDLSQEEAAALLGVSRKTIGKRLQRIRQEIAALKGVAGTVAP